MKLVMMGGPKDGVEIESNEGAPPIYKFLKGPPPISVNASEQELMEYATTNIEVIIYYRSHKDMDNPEIVYYSPNIKGVPFLGERHMG